MSDWAAAEVKASGQRGVITFEQLVGLGFKRNSVKWALASGRIVRVFNGVYRFPVATLSVEQRVLAAALVAGDHAAISHSTAGALWRLNGFDSVAGAGLHLSVPHDDRLRFPKGIAVHRSRVPFTPYRLRGFMVTRLARTIVDIAPLVTEERLEMILDNAQHRFRQLPRWLKEEVPLHKPKWHPGLSRLKELLSLREGVATESPHETRVRRAIRERGLPPPVLQFVIYDANGFVMRVDFAWPRHRVALHADGFLWHAQRLAFDRDAAQRSRLASLDWVSISLTSTALKSNDWLDQLELTLKQREPQRELFAHAVHTKEGMPSFSGHASP